MAGKTQGQINLERNIEAQTARREGRKQKLRHRTSVEETQVDSAAVVPVLVFVHRERSYEGLQRAWKALEDCATLKTYYRRFNYPDAKQMAVGQRRFELHDVHLSVARELERQLAPVWMKGKLAVAAEPEVLP